MQACSLACPVLPRPLYAPPQSPAHGPRAHLATKSWCSMLCQWIYPLCDAACMQDGGEGCKLVQGFAHDGPPHGPPAHRPARPPPGWGAARHPNRHLPSKATVLIIAHLDRPAGAVLEQRHCHVAPPKATCQRLIACIRHSRDLTGERGEGGGARHARNVGVTQDNGANGPVTCGNTARIVSRGERRDRREGGRPTVARGGAPRSKRTRSCRIAGHSGG